MAAGKPIVATSIEGYSSVITHDFDGLLVPPKDDVALAINIERLLKDSVLRQRLVKNAARTVHQYRWESVAGRVLDHYEAKLERETITVSGRHDVVVT